MMSSIFLIMYTIWQIFVICITGYTDTVSVYVNDDLLKISSLSLLGDAKYTCTIAPGLCKVRILKNSDILSKQWKVKVAIDLLSCIIGVPNYTLKEAMLEANQNAMCFDVNVTNNDQIIDIKLSLSMSGFEIVQGIEKCSEIQIENGTNNIALRRIKLFYLLPVVLLSVIIFGFLIGISIFFIIKAKYLLFSIVLTLIILLLTLFVYLIKPQYIAMKKANEAYSCYYRGQSYFINRRR